MHTCTQTTHTPWLRGLAPRSVQGVGRRLHQVGDLRTQVPPQRQRAAAHLAASPQGPVAARAAPKPQRPRRPCWAPQASRSARCAWRRGPEPPICARGPPRAPRRRRRRVASPPAASPPCRGCAGSPPRSVQGVGRRLRQVGDLRTPVPPQRQRAVAHLGAQIQPQRAQRQPRVQHHRPADDRERCRAAAAESSHRRACAAARGAARVARQRPNGAETAHRRARGHARGSTEAAHGRLRRTPSEDIGQPGAVRHGAPRAACLVPRPSPVLPSPPLFSRSRRTLPPPAAPPPVSAVPCPPPAHTTDHRVPLRARR
jgi:hypothetical protein